jgi:Mce-associated membrane protein
VQEQTTRRPGRRVPVLLGGLAVVTLVAVVLLALELREGRQLVDDRSAAMSAARQVAEDVTSISHRDAGQGIERILGGATGELEAQFRSERERLAQLLGTTRSTSSGTVLGSGVVRLEDRSATVLVAADAVVTTAETGEDEPLLQRYRMSMDLRKVGDRWLVERILFAGAPS